MPRGAAPPPVSRRREKMPWKRTGDVRPLPCLTRARAQSGARTAPPRSARGQAHARYARNRAAPQRGSVRPAPGPRARGRNQAREPRRRVTRAGAHVTRETGPRRTGGRAAAGMERHGREQRQAGLRKRRPGGKRAPRARPSRARAQSGARTAPPRNARGQAHARYARNRAAPQPGSGRRRGRNDTGGSRGMRDCDSGDRAGAAISLMPGPAAGYARFAYKT